MTQSAAEVKMEEKNEWEFKNHKGQNHKWQKGHTIRVIEGVKRKWEGGNIWRMISFFRIEKRQGFLDWRVY